MDIWLPFPNEWQFNLHNMKYITRQQTIEEQQKYVTAFNDTMVRIRKEQIKFQKA